MIDLPTLFWLAFFATICAVVLIVRWIRDAQIHAAAKIMHDWFERFPNKCPLCSFHRQAQLHGRGDESRPGEHYCVEGNSVTTLPRAKVWTDLP